MPIPVLGVEVPTPEDPGNGNPPPVIVVPPTPQPVKPSYRRRIAWLYPAMSADTGSRAEFLFTGDISGTKTGVIVQPGVKGLDGPPVSLTLDEMPALDGSVFRHSRKTTREVMLPLFLWAPDRASLVNMKHQLLRALNTESEPGTLAVTEYDGDGNPRVRYLDCYYSGGLDGDETQGYDFVCQVFGVTFQAPDPYWYGSLVNPEAPDHFDSTVPVNFFTGKDIGAVDEHIGPFFPLHLSKSTYVDDKTYVINNPGDIDAWPVWEINGTGASRVEITDIVSGQWIALDYEFATESDVVRIDTRPGYKTITNSNGDNLWPFTDVNTAMFRIAPGESRTKIDFVPTTEASIVSMKVDYSFYPRYLGA